MIILNSQKDKTQIKEILKKYHEMTNLPYLECPHCKSSNLIRWGFYNRNIYYIDDNKIVFETVEIQRIKCRGCGKTHALLFEPIIPYKQYLLDVIISSVNEDEITYRYEFSFDTIQKWKHELNKAMPYLKTMLNITKTKLILEKTKEDILGIYERFYKENKKILMMFHQGILDMSYF